MTTLTLTLTLTLLAISIVLALAAGILANSLRNRDKELAGMADSYNLLREELTQTQTARGDALYRLEVCRQQMTENVRNANQLRDRIEKAAKAVEAERNRLLTERKSLYFRNALGRIEPITPKPRKPHTLKHGMTVKDPSPYNTKRIFATAKRAGIETHQSATNDTNCIWFYGNDRVNSVCAAYAGAAMTTYISAREFLRRIKGEIE
jgi:hypothetical protein